ncbi:MAG: L-serine ammonia-lyase, iron-sulfur-dependent, subunit alpha [Lachnospiraceae bacterium]|nr:L-serine ammonia-lyase, iron-sulfur-dependent, subunit alpha [Lachnospiraceae bacterium]
MEQKDKCYQVYIEILKRELVPAMGCTEPIALAYCAAKARAVLGEIPQKVVVEASGNIIKNVKSVIVPNTNGEKGIEAAAAIGIVAGREDLELEVLSHVTEEQKAEFLKYLKTAEFSVRQAESSLLLDIIVTAYSNGAYASVRIANMHTNIVHIVKNGKTIFEKEIKEQREQDVLDYSLPSVRGIYDFAMSVDLEDVKEVLNRQVQYNTAISAEGLAGNYGANIGSVLLETYGDDIKNRAKAKAAAGSDARMNGCEMPVIINSGSGNQGMTVSLPVIEYAKELNVEEDKLYRALIISNLTAIHQKIGIGYLSAYCGAVSAGAAAGAGIAFLKGGGYEEIAHTIVNALAITSGIICDGAKASCAAKIATAVDAGIFGYDMYLKGQQFYGGEGVVSAGVENTIKNIGRLGKDGMRETDKEILCIMTCVD